MLSRRFVKQTVYMGGFLTFLIVVGGLFSLAIGPEEAPVETEKPVQYQKITSEEVSIISHENSVDIVVRLRNPNVRAGVAEYPVKFILLNAQDQEINTHTETTYILPGAVQYAAALNVTTGGNHVSRVKVELPENPKFSDVPAAVSLPTFSSFLHDRVVRMLGNTRIEEQRGIVENTSTFDWQWVEVVGVALDTSGDVVGVGKTFVGSLKIGEQRDFTLQWPAPTGSTDRVIVLPSTNIYLEENVGKIIGDPGSLR